MKKNYLFLTTIIIILCCKKEKEEKLSIACFDYSPKDNLIVGDTISFSNCSENSSFYLWDFGDGYYATDSIVKHVYEKAGDFKVSLSSSNNKFVDSLSKDIIIQPKEDNILYNNLGNEKFVSSVRFYTPFPTPGFCSDSPTPKDSIASINIDVDNNNIYDFEIIASHYQSDFACGSHCSKSNRYYIEIKALEPSDSIRITVIKRDIGDPFNICETLDSNTDISKNGIWSDNSYLSAIAECCIPCPYASLYDLIIGIRTGNKFGWLHVKPADRNGIYVLEYAINLTDYNSIKPGQK